MGNRQTVATAESPTSALAIELAQALRPDALKEIADWCERANRILLNADKERDAIAFADVTCTVRGILNVIEKD